MAANLGPLTTVFTPPAACLASSSTTYIDTTGPYFIGPIPSSSINCFPSSYIGSRGHYYSPALSCPVGYTGGTDTFITSSTETGVVCCPTSYSSFPLTQTELWASTYGCVFAISTPTVLSVIQLQGTTSFTNAQSTRAGNGDANIYAFSVQIRWQSTDLPAISTTSTSSASTSTASTTSAFPISTSTSTSSTTAPPISSSSNTGLSTGAAVGIGLGSAAAALLLAGAFCFAFRMGRRRRRQSIDGPLEVSYPQKAFDVSHTPPSLPKYSAYASSTHQPVHQPVVYHEAPCAQIPHELDDSPMTEVEATPLTPGHTYYTGFTK